MPKRDLLRRAETLAFVNTHLALAELGDHAVVGNSSANEISVSKARCVGGRRALVRSRQTRCGPTGNSVTVVL